MINKNIEFKVENRELNERIERQENQINSLNAIIINQRQIIEEQNNDFLTKIEEFENKDSLIPLGFLYTQYPLHSSPIELWPNMGWLEVTNKFANLFFRAEGPQTEPFGIIQQANQSWISNIITGGYFKKSFNHDNAVESSYPENKHGHWTTLFMNQAFFDRIELFTTDCEVRPKNTAIKIWKRIK